MEDIKDLLKANFTPTVVNDKSIKVRTKKAQLPYMLQALLVMIVPSTRELARMNEEFQKSNKEFLVFNISLNATKYTDHSKLQLITNAGYSDVSILRTLFFTLRLFYKEIKKAETERREVNDWIFITGSQVLKTFDMTDAGENYKLLLKHIRHLASTAFVADIEENMTGERTGLRAMKKQSQQDSFNFIGIKGDIEGIIRYEFVRSEELETDEEKVTLDNAVVLKIKLNDFLLSELKKNHFRLIDLYILNEKIKGDLAKIIYTYIVFHSQTSFSISIKKLCEITAIKYSEDKNRQYVIRKTLRKALIEISEATEETIAGDLHGEIISFGFHKVMKSLPKPKKNDYGPCPKCKKGKIVGAMSKKDGKPYWFCSRGKAKCGYIVDKEPVIIKADASNTSTK
jgi:hypothetical protein